MLFGSPLRAAISRNGSASPDERNADNNCAECTTTDYVPQHIEIAPPPPPAGGILPEAAVAQKEM